MLTNPNIASYSKSIHDYTLCLWIESLRRRAESKQWIREELQPLKRRADTNALATTETDYSTALQPDAILTSLSFIISRISRVRLLMPLPKPTISRASRTASRLAHL